MSNLTEVELKAKVREWIIVVSGCCFYSRRFKMAAKMTSDMEELVFLANAIRKTRRRRLNMQLLLRNLIARRRQVLNVALLLLLLVSERNNITVPRSICSCCRLNRNTRRTSTFLFSRHLVQNEVLLRMPSQWNMQTSGIDIIYT